MRILEAEDSESLHFVISVAFIFLLRVRVFFFPGLSVSEVSSYHAQYYDRSFTKIIGGHRIRGTNKSPRSLAIICILRVGHDHVTRTNGNMSTYF